jgi:pimeloyl-ACP methyl ester carboxylesterase
VEEAADFVLALMDAAGLEKAALIGHSFGSLIALEAAARAPHRVSQLVLVGIAFPMKVSPALIDASLNAPMKALEMVNIFSRSTLAPPPSAMGPGTWVYGASMALGRRVLASNTKVNVFHTGFKACDSYSGGDDAITKVSCPVLFLLGEVDQMTMPKAAQGLIAKARNAKVVYLPGGHHQMTETPEEMLKALNAFF